MGVTFFIVFIASMLAGLLFFVRKTNADSYIHGKKDDALDLQELRAAYQRNEIEHPVVEDYIDHFMRNFEDDRCEKDRPGQFDTDSMANEAKNGGSEEQSYAVN